MAENKKIHHSKNHKIKFDALKDFDDGKKCKEVCEKYDVKRTTFNNWLKDKDNIYAANNEISEEVSSKRRRLGNGKEKYKLVNDAIIILYKQIRDKNVPIDGVILSEKAKFFAKEFGLDDFLAS